MGRQGSTAQEQRGLHFYNKEEEGGEQEGNETQAILEFENQILDAS